MSLGILYRDHFPRSNVNRESMAQIMYVYLRDMMG